MRIVFMGTPQFAVPSCEVLLGLRGEKHNSKYEAATSAADHTAAASAAAATDHVSPKHEVVLVVTRPDAVRSRGKHREPSPVKLCAQEHGLPVLETSKVPRDVIDQIHEAAPDIIVVAAYGAIIPDEVLELPRLCCINVHASLLPRWRGAAPLQRAILAGDTRAGVSIMRVVSELDAGPFCLQKELAIGTSSADELTQRVAELGADALLEALDDIEAGCVQWTEQDSTQVTYAHKIKKAEMLLDPTVAAVENSLRVQASTDAAPARVCIAGKSLRVFAARAVDEGALSSSAGMYAAGVVAGHPGEVFIDTGRVFLGCVRGAFEILELRPDGKKTMSAKAWAAGIRDRNSSWEKL